MDEIWTILKRIAQNDFIKSFIYCFFVLIAIFFLVTYLYPSVFTMPADGLVHFLPYIKSHTDIALSGTIPKVIWSSGAGLSPFESGMVGVSYLPYHVANLLGRLFDSPFALLDISGWMHVGITCILSLVFLRHRFSNPAALAFWSIVLTIQPSPFILGINWHAYFTCYPWFLWLMLFTTIDPPTSFTPKDLLRVAIVHALFFWSAHPQMYALGVIWIFIWSLSLHGRKGLTTIMLICVAALPHLPSFAHLLEVVQNASPEFFKNRYDPSLRIPEEQTFGTVVKGILAGNLIGDVGFSTWINKWEGAGMFFCPTIVPVVVLALKRRKYGVLLLLVAAVLLMASRTFSTFANYTVFKAGLRWSWKLSWFVGPTAAIALLHWFPPLSRYLVVKNAIAGAFLIALIAVLVTGSSFHLLGQSSWVAGQSSSDVVEQTRKALQKADLNPGDRLAIVGGWSISEKCEAPEIIGLTGIAPLLAGYQTIHTFEPLENKDAAKAHWGISLPWRQHFSNESLVNHPKEIREIIKLLGANAIVSRSALGLRSPKAIVLRKDDVLYVEKIVPFENYPFGYSEEHPVPLKRLPGGSLVTQSSSEESPPVVPGRPITWKRTSSGEWMGTPVVYSPSMPLLHAAAWIVFILIATFLFVRKKTPSMPK